MSWERELFSEPDSEGERDLFGDSDSEGIRQSREMVANFAARLSDLRGRGGWRRPVLSDEDQGEARSHHRHNGEGDVAYRG